MQNTDPYLDYWRNQQKQQQAHNQYLAQQARKNLETIIQYLIQAFPIKKIILFGSLVKNKFQKSASFSCLLYHKKQGGHEKSAPGHRGFPRKYRTVDTTNFSSESGNWQ